MHEHKCSEATDRTSVAPRPDAARSSGQPEGNQEEIDQFDARKRGLSTGPRSGSHIVRPPA